MEFIATFDNTLEVSLIYEDENILEMTLNETVNPADSFMLGAAPSAKLELTLVFEEPPAIQFETAIIKPYIGLVLEATVEYVPIGVFYVDDISWHKKNRVTLTCFDGMVKLEKAYLTQLEYPAPLKDVAQEIADKAGVTLATTALPDTPVEGLYGYTLREAISFIASFIGGFARFNREGELEINGYKTTNFEITADNYFNLETVENPFTIGRLTCIVGKDEEGKQVVLTAGTTGNEIVFTNPLMTQEQLDSIYQTLSQLSYMPYTLKWQGNPALMAGDKITITDVENNTYVTLLMEQQIKYTGGLSATAEAKGKTEFAQEFQSAGPLSAQITRTGNAVKAYADRLAQDIADGKYKGTFIDETTIYSPIIAGLEGRFIGEVKVGTGNDIAGISGEGTNNNSIRFWAGHANKNQALFRVTQDGTIYAQKGKFSGELEGATGSFSGIVSVTDQFKIENSSFEEVGHTILALSTGYLHPNFGVYQQTGYIRLTSDDESLFFDRSLGNVITDIKKVVISTNELEIKKLGTGNAKLVTDEIYTKQIGTDLDGGDFWLTSNGLTRVIITSTGNVQANGSVTATSFSGSGANLTNLNASNLSSGTVPIARIPDLDASKITSGTLNVHRIPNLDASKITSGTFSTARIPNLDASKITSGTLSLDRIPTLPHTKVDFANQSLLTTSNVTFNRLTLDNGLISNNLRVNGGIGVGRDPFGDYAIDVGRPLRARGNTYLGAWIGNGRTVEIGGTLEVDGIPYFTGVRTTSASANVRLGDPSRELFFVTSSIKNKTDIETVYNTEILKVRPVRFRDKQQVLEKEEKAPYYLGVIAEEVHTLGLHELVDYDENGDPMAINYDRLAVALLPILKQHNCEIKRLKDEIEELKEKLKGEI